ncbi:MAG: uncharacterized membrane protein YjjB (DUF3815 family) [Phenylobacterium sp.]|jgi:uncharacterized membrane protein YjjB (DUF3815 family)
MNIFIISGLLLVLFLLARYAWAPKSNELFSSFYVFLCFSISTHAPSSNHPYISIESLLAVVSFCLLAQVFTPIKQGNSGFGGLQPVLRGIAVYSPMAFVCLYLLFNRVESMFLLMFATSAISFVLVLLMAQGRSLLCRVWKG